MNAPLKGLEVDDRAKKALRPYAPVVFAAVAFLLMAATVSTVERDREVVAGEVSVPLGPGTGTGTGTGSGGGGTTPGQTVTTGGGAGGATTGGGTTGGAGAGGGQSTGGGGTGGGQTGGDGGGGGGQAAAGGVQPCTDRQLQVPGDPYSPPCLSFSGDNGGATSPGVTADEIIVTIRELEGPSAGEIFADISGESVVDSPESYRNTVLALGEYFSQRFNFYGRSLRFEFFNGQGSGASELLGGGKEAALADAVRAKELNAFADLTAITTPYADAIATQQIVGIGAPYPSRNWFVERRPYAWSLFPDGTSVSEMGVSWTIARLSGQGTAEYAGDGLQGQPRKYGLVAPENAEYRESVERYIQQTEAAGFPFAVKLRYKLDINSMPNQAANIVAQMKDAGVTTIVCACDPVMLALGMAPKANEQNWFPEWISGGLAFMDQDIVAQLVDKRQWSHAFGTAYNAAPEPLGQSFPYAAYKSIRPSDEPSFGVEEIYYQMYMLALGIHLAGPNLTPQSFEAGMFSYPRASGPKGSWGFGPNDYTPTDDVRELWWDPDAISPQNNKAGTWVELNGGQRYFVDQFPNQPAPYFQRG